MMDRSEYPSKIMELVTREGVSFLQFRMLRETGIVRHAFSTRLGGVSSGIWESMNLSFKRGDDSAKVMENYRRMARALGVSLEDMVCSDQTHTANVRVIRDDERGMGVMRPQDFSDVDGMITNVPGIVLVTSHADCTPLFFVDPHHKAVGLSHSGWKGTAARIGEVTVRKMQKTFGSNPEDIIAAIGPSICRRCYEVGQDVVDEFERNFSAEDMNRIFDSKGGGKYQLDLWKANELILLECGILPRHLAVTDVCTFENPDLLWSHRYTHGRRGGMSAFLQLLPEEEHE